MAVASRAWVVAACRREEGCILLPILVPDGFRIIAHRGASAYAPENSRAAFRLAADMGVREFELDAQLSSDGTVILCHDATLERYGHGPRSVEGTPWAQLAQLDMGSWFSPHLYRGERMLTLDELFDEYRETVIYHLEIKGKAERLPELVCRAVAERGLRANCVVTSFSSASLAASRSYDAGLRLGWLVQSLDGDTLAAAQPGGLFQLCPRAATVTPEQVRRAHAVVPEVRAWGVSGRWDEMLVLIHNVLASGCDGMTINWPDWVSHRPPRGGA